MRAEIEVRNPRTGQVDYRVTPPDSHQLRAIASELRAAQPEWLARGVEGRCEVIRNWSQSLVGAPDALIDALSHDTGRYLLAFAELMALPGMVDRWCKIAPVLLDTAGERESVSPGVGIRDQLVPYELVGIISPWNFPLLLSMIDAVPALVAGCAVLVKPSEVTPRFIEPMMASIRQFPELASVFRFVVGDGQTGAELIENVDAVAFTGSVKTGRIVAEACAKRFIPSFLELGGKDPCIVLPSADMADAARIVLRSSVQATGQACQSLERIYVPREHFDEFVGELVRQAEALELNYPDIHKGQIGPLIFDRQAEVIEEQLQDAVAKGARILCGGEIEHHGGGTWIRPTVLIDVDHSMKIMREETFGPVMPVMAYDSLDEAVELANDTDYGLSAAVIGADLDECDQVARRLRAGAVSINDGAMTTEVHDAAHDSFGLSGLGVCRMGHSGLTRYLRRKALLIRHGEAKGMDSLDESLMPAKTPAN